MTMYSSHDEAVSYNGMSLRDYYAAHAPIDFAFAMRVFGWNDDNGPSSLTHDADRISFLCVWAALRYEYADEMLAARRSAPLSEVQSMECDCQNPEPESGVALVSIECPIHGDRP